MISFRNLKNIDWALLILVLLICAAGILQIYSATQGTKWKDAWWKQIVWISVGLLFMWIVSMIDYHTLLGNVPIFYGVTLVLLILTFFIGIKVFGARRWIALPGGVLFQTSEFAKIVIILLVARFLSEIRADQVDWRNLLKLGALVSIPMLLVMKQPDLGTSLTYVPVVVACVFVAGLRWYYWAILLGLALVSLPVGWHFLKDYQKSRIQTFLNPDQDPKGEGYQVSQSKIAIGNGGMWGKGVTRGTQTNLQFLPVPHTDFIFSTFAEEHGFVGVAVVLGLYFLLLMQIVQNAQSSSDKAGMYLCIGVCALLLFHLLVNIGMVVGRMPVTGIPLPFMSSGGSGMMSIFMMLGLVHSVRLRRLTT